MKASNSNLRTSLCRAVLVLVGVAALAAASAHAQTLTGTRSSSFTYRADGLLASPTPFGEADAVIGQTSVPLPDVPRADAAGNGLKYTVQVLLGFAT